MHKTRALQRTPPKPILEERLLLTSLFCISIINYLVFLVWSEVSHLFEIIGVVVRHLLIADVTEHILRQHQLPKPPIHTELGDSKPTIIICLLLPLYCV